LAKRKSKLHPVEQYARDVLNNKIIACKWVKLACQRHLNDLKEGHKRGFFFDGEAANHAIKFFSFLHHVKGEWAKPPAQIIELELWQQFITGSIFGWMGKEGIRRFRTAYIEVGRKNSKTTMGAGWGGYLFFADNEPGAEVYSAATSREQAKISFEVFQKMVQKNKALSNRIQSFRNALSVEKTFSKFQPLSSDYNTLDGLNIHGAICDELHKWRTRDLWDVIETATGARRQPLLIAITTAGFDRESICWEQHEYTEKILNGTIKDDTYFGIIYTIDEGDRWDDEKIWIKANPNLGISVKLDDLQRKCKKAREVPAAQNSFLRKHLCVWTQQSTRWIDLDVWDENYLYDINEDDLKGRLCYGGLDLSAVSDLTAWVMLFPDEDDPEQVDILARFWCPEAKLYDRRNRYKEQYQAWARQGLLKTTPGDAIDYQHIKAQIVKDAKTFRLDTIGVDRLFQGYQLSMEINEELGGNEKDPKVVAMGMGFLSMAAPMKEFESRLLKRKLNHGNNPILRWMADNLAVKEDPAGNLKPDKATSQGKIDGIVGILLALDRLMRQRDSESVYDKRAKEGQNLLTVI
jgi:phage terminase large subunit-like protein